MVVHLIFHVFKITKINKRNIISFYNITDVSKGVPSYEI